MQKTLFSCVFLVCLAGLQAFPFDNFNNYGDMADQQDAVDQQDFNAFNNPWGDLNGMGDTPDAADFDTPDAADFDIFGMNEAAAAAGQAAGEQVAGGDSSGGDSGESAAGSFVGIFGAGMGGGDVGGGTGGMGMGAGMGGGDTGNYNGMGFVGNPGNDFETADGFDNDPGLLNAAYRKKGSSNGASAGIAIATIALVVGAATVAIVVIRRQRQTSMQPL
ncbi:uncharacterized protein [Diadema setosum]|uniref:uncharacterized protein n=1 Tax=Diadema setosum TaxID=31175 RepID=UPI003B3A9103